MADTAVLLEIITYIFQSTPPTADCDEPLKVASLLFCRRFSSPKGLGINKSSLFATEDPTLVVISLERARYRFGHICPFNPPPHTHISKFLNIFSLISVNVK